MSLSVMHDFGILWVVGVGVNFLPSVAVSKDVFISTCEHALKFLQF